MTLFHLDYKAVDLSALRNIVVSQLLIAVFKGHPSRIVLVLCRFELLYLFSLYCLLDRLRLPWALAAATLCWGVAAFVLILGWSRWHG